MNALRVRAITIATILLSSSVHVTSQFCPKGTCYAGTFSRKEHVTKGHYLLGASYRNLTSVASPQACHSACIGDCRCRAFQISGKRCELLDEDKDTVPISRFLSDDNYEYYDLEQRVIRASYDGTCSNGCCMGQQCPNGKVCVELCDDPKKKFACTWAPDSCVYRSCLDYLVAERGLGRVPVEEVYKIQIFPVYCSFEHGNTTWTLLESFMYTNRAEFSTRSFMDDAPSNFPKYRLSRDRMQHVHINATMFKATCSYDKKDTITGWPRDQIIARIADYDVINQPRQGECYRCCLRSSEGSLIPLAPLLFGTTPEYTNTRTLP